MRLFHIVDRGVWAEAAENGQYLPEGYDHDGFVHFSFADQVAGVANAAYRGAADPVVVEIESEAVPGELRVEDSYGSGTEYPHIYGPIPATALRATHELTRAAGGDWMFSLAAADGPSSTDR